MSDLSEYLAKDKDTKPKTIRAPEDLWKRLEALAKKRKCSLNRLIVAALTKLCDEEEAQSRSLAPPS